MKKFATRTYIMALSLGILAAFSIESRAVAADPIRPNPDYFANSVNTNNNEVVTESLHDDLDDFLNLQNNDEPDQYILITESNDKNRAVVSLNEANQQKNTIQLNQEYIYNPGLSFNLPITSLTLGGSSAPSLLSGDFGGSQLIMSVAPSNSTTRQYVRDDSFQLLFGSSFMQRPVDRYNALFSKSSFAEKAYNLSVGLGYSGFHLGASYSRNEYLLASDLSGFDFNFGYSGERWTASLRAGEYSRSRTLLLSSEYNIFDNVSAYELGAAYRLFSNVNFTGRFTYYSYGQANNVVSLDDIKTLMFGTNLSF